MNPVAFYKCLADETRLRLLLLLRREGELCVCELTQALAESQPKISRHLARLKQCGLLQDRRQGIWIFYRLAPSLPCWAATVLEETTRQNAPFLAENMARLQRMGARPARTEVCCPPELSPKGDLPPKGKRAAGDDRESNEKGAP